MVPFAEYVAMAKQSNDKDFVMQDIINRDIAYTLYVQRVGLDAQSYIGFMVPTKVMQKPYMGKVRVSIIITFAALL